MGFKAEFRGAGGRLGVYFANLSAEPLGQMRATLGPAEAASAGLVASLAAGPDALAARGQGMQARRDRGLHSIVGSVSVGIGDHD